LSFATGADAMSVKLACLRALKAGSDFRESC
jgi:hypothetical protein